MLAKHHGRVTEDRDFMSTEDDSLDGNPLVELVADLEFTPVDERTAVGEFQALPAAISVLGLDPPAFMFQIRLNPVDDEAAARQDEIEPLVSDSHVSMSIENDCAYLSVYDASEFETDELRMILDRMAESLLSSGQARKSVCLRCGQAELAELMYVEGRPTRLCTACLEAAAEQREQEEAALNATSGKALLALPLFAAVATGVWGVFWLMIDLALDYWQMDVIEINRLTMLLILGLLGAVGWLAGWPLGRVLRRTVFGRKLPRLTGTLMAGLLIVVGEVLYVGLLVLWHHGVIDPEFAVRVTPAVVLDYTGFWLVCKLTLAGAVGFFCCLAAGERKTVALDI